MVVMPLIVETHPDENEDTENTETRYFAGNDYRVELNEETSKVFKPNPKALLNHNRYLSRTRDANELATFDTIITYSWNGNYYGPCSSWYDAFELWYMIKYNIPLEDFGGKKIALLFPDIPSTQYQEEVVRILLSIFDKYKITETTFYWLVSSIFFLDNPEELYLPHTNLVCIDGKVPSHSKIEAKDLYLQIVSSLKEDTLQNIKYRTLNVYHDPRINQLIDHYKQTQNIEIRKLDIARSTEPKTNIFSDIRRINFNMFTRKLQPQASSQKRFLLYVTPKNRSIYLTTQSELNMLDDILDTLPDTAIGTIGKQIKSNQRDLWNYFRKDCPQTGKSTKYRNLTDDEILAVANKGTIFGNGISESEVISQEPKIKIIIVGLTPDTRDFESKLIARAMTRGLFIATETITSKDLPVLDIHTKYDYYIFTPAKDWTTSRFIPEAIYHKKKILYTDKALKQLKMNIPLAIRINDSENYLTYLAEDDIYSKPKSLLAKHLISL